MRRRRRIAGVALLGVGLVLLALAGWLYLAGCGPTGDASPTPAPSPTASPRPSFTPFAPPSITPPQGVNLLVRCNVTATLHLNTATGEPAAQGDCSPQRPRKFWNLPAGRYSLTATSPDRTLSVQLSLDLFRQDNETIVLFPGVLEVRANPAAATVEVDGVSFHGAATVTYTAAQCPYTATVYLYAPGYFEDGRLLRVEAGKRNIYLLALRPQPTVPPTAVPPTRPPVTALPTTPPWTVEDRVALVRQKLYESVNCIRAEEGLPPIPFVWEWQPLADDFARGWRDHFRAYGVEGFDDSPWRQQFQANGGDAVPDSAGLVLYAPEYYVYAAPRSRWETFNMCDATCPAYNWFQVRKTAINRASGVVIGMSPWWDGDMLKSAVVIGFQW